MEHTQSQFRLNSLLFRSCSELDWVHQMSLGITEAGSLRAAKQQCQGAEGHVKNNGSA